MKRVLAAAVLVACTAHAQDKGKADFSANGEFRVRDTFEQNESGQKNTQPAHHNGIEQRFKMGVKFKANEKFSAAASLINGTTWGQPKTDGTVGVRSAGDDTVLLVNEAYGTWMMSEDLHFKVGRQNFTFGDGSVMPAIVTGKQIGRAHV